MEKIDFKNHEMDQSVSFEVVEAEKNRIQDSSNSMIKTVVREPSRLKKEQEVPGAKPIRKRRRKLTGW